MSDVLARIEACIPPLRRYAWALLRDARETDDLVQECLVRALDRIATRREDQDVRAWLFAIMHNLFVSGVRTRRRHRDMEAAEGDAAAAPEQESALRFRDLLRALDALPEEQRQIVLLVAVEGFSYAEVARIQGVPVGTVMSRLSRARNRLRDLTDGYGQPLLRRVK